MRKRLVEFIVPAAIIAVFAALHLTAQLHTAEMAVYNLLLKVKPAIPQRDDILFMDVDDLAISNVGLWPWSRDYMARGLIYMREFNSSYVGFDIEYVDASPRAVNADYLEQQLPRAFESGFGDVEGAIRSLFQALVAGQITLREANDFVDDLAALSASVKEELQGQVSRIVQNNDDYLGRAAAFHGQAFFTVNILREPDPGLFDRTYAEDRVAQTEVTTRSDARLFTGVDIRPTIEPVLRGAGGAGFPNVVVDDDGVRRRIDLMARVGDHYYAQLITAPLLDWLGGPEIEIDSDRISFKGALLPGASSPSDIVIPLAEDGRMLINWPKATFLESFRHLSYWRLVDLWESEALLVQNLRSMAEANYLFFAEGGDDLLPLYDYAEAMKEESLGSGDRSQVEEWREYREMFFQSVGDLLSGDGEELLLAELQAAIDSGELDTETSQTYAAIMDDARSIYQATRGIYDHLIENRNVLKEVDGSFVIIGWVGTSTTDIGVNPFEKEYMNVGTHAAVLNTILQQQFLDDLPWWIPFGIAAILALAITALFVVRDLPPTTALLIGFGVLVLIAAGGVAVFLTTGIFVNLVTPLAIVFLTFITLSLMRFIVTNREKNQIRFAFNHYLAADVINQVIADPDKLQLGGEKRELTALFTDIKGFSSISENLESTALVELLNRYLTEMSDIILEERGLIDKYIGDAIVSFWGAPVSLTDSAVRACRAAIRMKKLEERLNKEFLDQKLSPSPVLTRVGINTGEMTVGNMGTASRMNYTIMGHNVNLAARLEGVNKQYGTWILVSEQTYRETGRAFSVRKLDRVRVVGISEPVRLYELIDLREEVDKDHALIEKLRTFNAGLNAFEGKEYLEAETNFRKVLDGYPDDGPAKYYADRCKVFKKKPPSPDWDGVFNLQKK